MCSVRTRHIAVKRSIQPGAPARFQVRVGKHFGENLARSAEKFFALPILVFSLPTLDLTTRVGKHFGENLARSAEKFFALPILVFSLPTLDLTTRVGKDPPAIIIAFPLALRTVHFAYQFVYTIISNYTTLNIQWQQFRNVEFDKCFNRSNKCKDR